MPGHFLHWEREDTPHPQVEEVTAAVVPACDGCHLYPVRGGSNSEFCITLSGVQSSARGQKVLFHPKAIW